VDIVIRSAGLGLRLPDAVSAHGARLGMCAPRLPEFERTLAFYRRNGFEITGGRKMKHLL
jgi:hypothetical protein